MYAQRNNTAAYRVLSFLLVLCMVMSYLPVFTFSTTVDSQAGSDSAAAVPEANVTPEDTFFDRVKLCCDGKETTYAEIYDDSHLTVSAIFDGGNDNVDSFTWQIYDPVECCWISISGTNSPDLQIGAAMIAQMLNESQIAVINCKLRANNALYYSDTIQVKLLPAEPEEADALTPAEPAEPAAEQDAVPSSRKTRAGGVSGGELITYTVKVEYINYLTGEYVVNPYVANVKDGGDDQQLIVYPDSPIVVGFTPYIITQDGLWDAENPAYFTGLDATNGIQAAYEYMDGTDKVTVYGKETHKLALDLSTVTQNMVYRVYYMPNKVFYTVSHYVQNIVNDDYVLYYVETKPGYVGQMTDATNLTNVLPDNEENIPSLSEGFTALTPFKNQVIAADGTTQINTYYDRMYYLVTFKLDGGRGTEPIYARYGASIHTTVPVKTGYEFAGWVKLEMTQSQGELYTPRPAVDANGNYKPLYTDENRKPLVDKNGQFYYVKLVADTDNDGNDEYWGPVDSEGKPVNSDSLSYGQYALITNEQLPATMPAFHSAMLAVWHKAETEYTVIYWLEHADRTGTNDVLTKDDFDYWCAVTRYAQTGTRLDAIYKELENPLLSDDAPEVLGGYYVQLTNIDVTALNGMSLAIVSNQIANKALSGTAGAYGGIDGLERYDFDDDVQSFEWTFVQVSGNTYKIKNGDQYLCMAQNGSSGKLSVGPESQATEFTVTLDPSNPNLVAIMSQGRYLNPYANNSSTIFAGWHENNSKFKLYQYYTETRYELGTGASAINQYFKVTGIADKLDKLNGYSFALVSHAHEQYVKNTQTTAGYLDVAGLERGTFEADQQAVEWTFVQVSGNTYKLKSGNQYMRMDGNKLYCDATEEKATIFTVEQYGAEDSVTIGYNNQYINSFGGASQASFAGYGTKDSGCALDLYHSQKIDDPEAVYYYYYYSDFRDLDTENNVALEQVNEITVTDDGKTTVNVYFRRREYNLRFFYARSHEESNATTGEKETVYQVIGGSSYQFSKNENATTTKELLETISNDRWGRVEKPTYLDPNKYYTPGTYTEVIDGYEQTYYYFILKVRYGQNIADEWPSENMLSTKRVGQTQNGSWTGDQAIFSAWNGEFWLRYSREHTDNYTIKGNYQAMDEVLMYDPSFNINHKAEKKDSEGNRYGYYYERGTGTRYLDFVAFYENGSNWGWNVPKQFHYYLWIVSDDQSQAAIDKAITDENLPNSHTDFAAMVEKSAEGATTLAYIDGVVYELYDKVDSCDNSDTPSHQTVPGIAGYDDISSKREGGYPSSLTEALAQKKYYYANDDWDTDVYQNSYTLHFRFKPRVKNITLQSWNHIKVLPNIAYGSMLGATWITEGLTLENGEFDPGYMYDQMMEYYYPQDLPEGAYYFAGWYKTPDYIPGTMANFDKPMPNYNMMLYAKWEPIRFNVHVHQTGDLSDLVYYVDEDDNDAHKPMKSEVVRIPLVVHGQKIMVGQEGTGKGYGEYLPTVVPAAGPDKTYEEVDGLLYATIPENCSGLDYADGSGQIRNKWIFVCYAYMKDGVEHAVDVSSFTITEDVELYAKWTAVDIVDYRVDYVLADLEVRTDPQTNSTTIYGLRPELDSDGEIVVDENKSPVYMVYDENYVETGDGVTKYHWPMLFNDRGRLVYSDGPDDLDPNDNDEWVPQALTVMQEEERVLYVADSVSGKVNEGANRTFQAKTGNQLYEDYRSGYFPLHVSHGTLMTLDPVTGAGESVDNPIVTTFYYVPLKSVPYTVEYLNLFGNPVAEEKYVDNSGDNMKMVVTENYLPVEGYVSDAFQKTLVLSANLEANVITFNYEKDDDKVPYTILYYYETLGTVVDDSLSDGDTVWNYRLHHELSGRVDVNGPLDVDYLDITGYEYAQDTVIRYSLGDDMLPQQSGDPMITNNRGDKKNIPTGNTQLELTDLRGHKVTVKIENGTVVFVNTDGHEHNLSNSIFTYQYDNAEYRVEDIRIEDGKLVIDGYADPTGSFQLINEGTRVELGEYGTLIKVYYNLRYYPYYIIHKIDGANGEELDVSMGLEKFQSSISGTAMSEEQLLEHDPSYAGYAAKDEDKSITITMTIQDDGSTPHINTITFLYYEKMMEFDYVPMLLKNPGVGESIVVQMPEDEPNAKINLVRDYIKSVTGTADAAYPVIYEEAYEFLGWFLDEECKQPVANSHARLYLGTGTTQDSSGNSMLTGQLEKKDNNTPAMEQNEYSEYDVLLPQKLKEYQYLDSEKGELVTKDLAKGVYVGAFDAETNSYQQKQTFYALFVPKLGTLTITRSNVGPDVGFDGNGYHEAHSFVFTIRQLKDADGKEPANPVYMQVTVGPEDFVLDATGGYTASVVITGLPRGTYEVKQENAWSWRYDDTAQSDILFDQDAQFQTVVFQNGMQVGNWLSGFAEILTNSYDPTQS